MKKTLSFVLAAIFLASVLASCASFEPQSTLDPKITVTSSDAKDAAQWLDARLETIPDRIVIGTDASSYGVDVSALEDDGYIIRHIGDEIALFAKSADGLDRAARKYAKTVEKNETVANEVFHEGARIEELRLAGNDISTYAISVDCKSKYLSDWVTDSLAGTFGDLIGYACGFSPEVGAEAEHYIILRQVDRADFRESSYNYHFENGDLIIEFIDFYGARNGALLFLQNECGWSDLAIGYDVLAEAELVEVSADLDVTVHPTLEGGVDQGCLRVPYSTIRKVTGTISEDRYVRTELLDRTYKIPSAHHALGTDWAYDYGVRRTSHYVCLTSEEVFEETVEEITNHIATRIASGEKMGEDIYHIDLGMEDGNIASGTTFCNCKDCRAVYLEEGAAWAGPMIRFANRVEEAVDAAKYDGIKYSVFAYVGSQMPPKKTAPNDDIYVTIVTHEMCDKHFIDGSQCTGSCALRWMIDFNRSYTGGRRIINNEDWASWIKGWHALGAHLYIRVATLSSYFHPFMTMYEQYENMKFFVENGVMSIYNESYAYDGLDFNYLVGELYQILQYYPGLSRAEYYEHFDRLLEKYYGEGWREIRELCDLIREAELREGCTSAWCLTDPQYDDQFILDNWDKLISLADSAANKAGSALEERFCAFAKCIVLRIGCAGTYRLYGTKGAQFDLACERWKEMVDLLAKHGHPIVDASTLTGYHFGVQTGNVIFFNATQTGYWPSAEVLEPTFEAMIEHDLYY